MLFQRPDGRGVLLRGAPAPSESTSPLCIAKSTMLFARGETFERYRSIGFSIEQISEIFNIGTSTIYADLKRLTDERARRAAEGHDPLPLFGT